MATLKDRILAALEAGPKTCNQLMAECYGAKSPINRRLRELCDERAIYILDGNRSDHRSVSNPRQYALGMDEREQAEPVSTRLTYDRHPIAAWGLQ